MKPIMITLMYLTFGGDIKLDSFEIHSSCSSWFHNNVKIVENKKRTLFSSHVYHEYKGKKVIGYVCEGHEPQKTSGCIYFTASKSYIQFISINIIIT